MLNTRNHILGFAKRTRKNLAYIEAAFHSGADVHVVTQLANSMLGLIVLPLERDFDWLFKGVQLEKLVKQGWPRWEITGGDCKAVTDLLWHLRNGAAHGHLLFSSDSRFLEEVTVEVADFKPGAVDPHWVARIQGSDLRAFCLKLSEFIEDRLG